MKIEIPELRPSGITPILDNSFLVYTDDGIIRASRTLAPQGVLFEGMFDGTMMTYQAGDMSDRGLNHTAHRFARECAKLAKEMRSL